MNSITKANKSEGKGAVRGFFGDLGPGLITGAADDDSWGISTVGQTTGVLLVTSPGTHPTKSRCPRPHNVLGGKLISEQVVQSSWNVAVGASAKGTLDCVPAWGTDFRHDLARIKVPTLVIHGDADRILPLAATGTRTHKAVKGARLLVVEGGPHGLTWTHAEKVNRELLDFLG